MMTVKSVHWNSWVSSKSPYDSASPAERQGGRTNFGRIGFQIVRTRGSHVFLRHEDGRVTTVPVHSGETLGPGLLRSILRDVEMTVDELLKLS
jgi:predicted RNA binding protein YcfA (HicA-like mRNA interferase family)